MKFLFSLVRSWAKQYPDNPWALILTMIIIMLIASIIIALFTTNQTQWQEHK